MITIRYEGFAVAQLEEDASGAPQLRYEPRWLATPAAFPVSLLLPLGPAPVGGRAMARWLSAQQTTLAALPDGEPEERFGGLSFSAPDAAAPIGLGAGTARLLGEGPSTHWRRLDDDPDRPGALENRALCMRVATAAGVPAAPITLRLSNGAAELLAARSDRLIRSDGAVIRLHGEDFALAHGASQRHASDRRRRTDGESVGLREIFALADRHFDAEARLALLDTLMFLMMINDVDADARRVRLLLSGGVRLAPLEDASTLGPWAAATERRLALRAPDAALRADQVTAPRWREVASACGLNQTFILTRFAALGARVRAAIPGEADKLAAEPALRAPIVAYFARLLEETVTAALAAAAREERAPLAALNEAPKTGEDRAEAS